MGTTCGKCSGTLTVEVYERIAAYMDMCVQLEDYGITKGVDWAAHLQNKRLDLSLLASHG